MRIQIEIQGRLDRLLAQDRPKFFDAANRAVDLQTSQALLDSRTEITRGLGSRAANAYRRKRIVDPDQVAVGFLHSSWWRKSRGGGPDIDLFQAYEDGALITPKRGKYLAVPLPAAYSVVGMGRNRPTPRKVELALGTELFLLKRMGRLPLLMAKDISITGGTRMASGKRRGATARIRGRLMLTKKGKLARRRLARGPGGEPQAVPMFVMLRNARLPKRLDFDRFEEQWATGMATKLELALAARGLFD